MAGWVPLSELLKYELIQAQEEGRDVADLEEQVQAALDAGDDERINEVYDLLISAPLKSDYPYDEPFELDEIFAHSPQNEIQLIDTNSPSDWTDKFYGAWLGRCIGCALGKPLEMRPFTSGNEELPGWKHIQNWFEHANAFPIHGFTPGLSPYGEVLDLLQLRDSMSHRENIQFMESDDDIRYTVLGLLLLEKMGRDWTTWDVGKNWHNNLTYGQVCTAETQAYLNFANITYNTEGKYFPRPNDWQSKLEWVRSHRNPFREWIGAQIRADGYAFGTAGNPMLAAEFAWRDASFSHVKNGIYGEMYIAAIIAAAFIESDNQKLIEIGLSVIPANCRLAHDIKMAVELVSNSRSQLELVERIWDAFCHYDPFHTNNNASLVTAALLFGEDNFELGITTAVLGGWDTDCNGATVGSIMGAKLGTAKIPHSWKNLLNDTLYAEIPGFHPIDISECARRSHTVWRKIRNA